MRTMQTHLDASVSKDKIRRKKKSLIFFERMKIRRSQPGVCIKCGHDWPGWGVGRKICPPCREKQNQRYARLCKTQASRERVELLERRIASLENAVAVLQITKAELKQAETKGYNRGFYKGEKTGWKKYGERLTATAAQERFDAMEKISFQELKTINHAYEGLDMD